VVNPARRNKLVSVKVLRHSWSMRTGFYAGAARVWHRTRGAARRAALACLVPSPARSTGVNRGFLADLLRAHEELLAENAFLRHQLAVARGSKKPRFRVWDRFLLVALSRMFSRWRDALVLIKPDTLLRWHRDGFRLFWKWRSWKKPPAPPRVPPDVVDLIRHMATENRLWGAERIRGELLKLGISVAKRTIQRYLSKARSTPPDGQRWSSFLRLEAAGIWACDFVEVRDLWFRSHFVFVVIHLETRQLLHAASTSAPTVAWTVQQLRDLTPFGIGPKFLLRDNDGKFTPAFDAVALGAGIRVIRTPVLAPKANAFVERFVGSLRRECLDHILVLGEGHLQRVLDEYRYYFNASRPHQGIEQRRPAAFGSPAKTTNLRSGTTVDASPVLVLGGLHHDETPLMARMHAVANTGRRRLHARRDGGAAQGSNRIGRGGARPDTAREDRRCCADGRAGCRDDGSVNRCPPSP
jgi:putative transposase